MYSASGETTTLARLEPLGELDIFTWAGVRGGYAVVWGFRSIQSHSS